MVRIYAPDHPRASKHNGCVAEHIVILEKSLGRSLELYEVVHHRDNNPSNNEFTNLKPLRRGLHSSLHGVVSAIIAGDLSLEDVEVLLNART